MRVDCSFFRHRDPAGLRGTPLNLRPRIPRVSSDRQVVTWRGLFGGGGEGVRKNEGLRSAGVMRARLEKGKGRGKRWAVFASGFGLGWCFGEWWAGCRNGARPSWGALAGRRRAWSKMRLVEDEPLGGRSSFYFSKTANSTRDVTTQS